MDRKKAKREEEKKSKIESIENKQRVNHSWRGNKKNNAVRRKLKEQNFGIKMIFFHRGINLFSGC